MEYLPVFLKIRESRCLIVGGGEVAYRKAVLLCRAGGRVTVVAREINAALQQLLDEHHGMARSADFKEVDLEGMTLVIAATDDAEVNARVSSAARERNLPVNVVDQPELCTFIVPAVVDRSPVVIAISSGGTSPILTRQLKEKLEVMIPNGYGRLASVLGAFRATVKTTLKDLASRKRFWEKLLAGPLSEMVFAGKEEEAKDFMHAQLAQAGTQTVTGEVYLVGAGPGDPDLLTLRALRLMQQADVVLYDRLVSNVIMEKVRPDAERIYVGKARADHSVPQEQINAMLIRLAGEGKKVLRLKGGDPFIFGRGGEEIEGLSEARIPFQVIPGITAASGCACYAGIPLTHRDYSQSVRFVTGHVQDEGPELDWQQLASERQTVVFYMGLAGLPKVCGELLAHGMEPDMPMGLVQQGTTPNQKVLTGTLSTMVGIVEANSVVAPTIIIVGRVVKLHKQYAWFQGGHVAGQG